MLEVAIFSDTFRFFSGTVPTFIVKDTEIPANYEAISCHRQKMKCRKTVHSFLKIPEYWIEKGPIPSLRLICQPLPFFDFIFFSFSSSLNSDLSGVSSFKKKTNYFFYSFFLYASISGAFSISSSKSLFVAMEVWLMISPIN